MRSPGLLAGLGAAAIVLATLTAYVPAMQAGYVWDDDYYVTENEFIRSGEGLRRAWLEFGATLQYYPLVHTTLFVEHSIWGLEPAGYHVVNILLHTLSALLLWRLLACLGLRGAWLAAALFALHPVHVESVAWITERKNVLSGVLYLAAALVYLRFSPLPAPASLSTPPSGGTAEPARDWRFYPLLIVLFALALFAKTVTASLPAAILLVVWWKRGRLRWDDAAPLVPLMVLGAALGVTTAWMEKNLVGAAGADWSLGIVERLVVAGRVVWFYAGKLVWPHPLCFVYPRWTIDGIDAHVIYPIAAAAVVAALWLARGRIGRGPLAAVLFFGGTLFPALGFIDVYPHSFSYVADHFQYLASVGLIALGAEGVALARARLPVRASRGLQLLVAAWLAAFCWLVWQQARNYQSIETLFGDVIVHNPDSYLAHSHLGNVFFRRGDYASAIPHYTEALRIRPNDEISTNNMAWALATSPDPAMRDGQRAVELAERAARLTDYGIPGVLDTLAAAYAAAGRYRRAVETARQAIELARSVGDFAQAREIEQKLRLYQRGRPYHER